MYETILIRIASVSLFPQPLDDQYRCRRKTYLSVGFVLKHKFNNFWENFDKSLMSNFRQKQPPRGVLRKRSSENMQQIYRRAPMLKCYFNKVALQLY